MKRMSVLAAGLLLPLTGCGLIMGDADEEPAEPGGTTAGALVGTTFTRIGGSGYIDMSLELQNPGTEPLVLLNGDLVARDSAGEELPGVRVTTAFRTPLGGALIPPGGAIDFVQLEGEGEEDVRDVTLEGGQVAVATGTEGVEQLVELIPLDKAGDELDYDAAATKVRLTNPNTVDVRVRVVLMVLGTPADGQPQEAELVHDDATTEVPAGGSVTVDLDAKTVSLLRKRRRDAFVTLRPVLAGPTS